MKIQTIQHGHSAIRRNSGSRIAAGSVFAIISAIGLLGSALPANAIGTAVDLGTAGSYSVLGGQSVTNTGSSVLNADLGVSPGTAISGFPPGTVLGTTHAADAHALQAQADLVTAYDSAAGQNFDASIAGDLGGLTLLPGVYKGETSLGLTGNLTLDAQGDPNAVFIFQIGSTLTTASDSSVTLINGAQSCNVFWQVGSSATLGTDSTFVGNILAMESITATTGATIDGRALARNGSVTLDTNTFTNSACVLETPEEPPVVPAVEPPVTPPVGDSSPPVSDEGTPGQTVATLAATGASDTLPLVAAAAGMMLMGALLTMQARRRR